ncbi:MAG TPA: type 4a pilus biogenesis protein PilO [Opitutaceae bacterium]|nr:type 4a pilus biogenesis protein PilO [Opitutaceae bacterium]
MNPQLATALGVLRRYPYCAACVLLTILLGAGAWYLRGENDELLLTHADRSKEGESMLSLLVGGSTWRQELATARTATHRIEENLAVETNLAENTWYFFKFEEQAKVRLTELHQLNSPPSESTLYSRVPYTLRVAGEYEGVENFLHAVETGPRLVKITSFTMNRGTTGMIVLDLNLEVLGKK